MKVKSNLHLYDRIARAVLAVGLAVLYFTNVISGTLGLVLVVAGVIFLITSFISWCPIYAAFGFSTAPKKE